MPAWRPRRRNHPTCGWYPVGPSSWPTARRLVSLACASRSSPPALATHIQLIALLRTYGGGSHYTILDACKAAELGALGAAAKRLPRWLLPAAPTETELARALTNKDQYTVQVVEVGYCSDYSWRDKVQAKLEQHAALVGKLREEGWKVDEAPHVIVVGAKGAVFLRAQQALQRLGLDKASALQRLTEINVFSVEAAYEITLARRRMEGSARTRVG